MDCEMILVGTSTQPILFGTGEVLNAKGKGIYLYALREGQLSLISETAATHASFLIVNGKHTNLYTTNELKEYEGQFGGAVSAYQLDLQQGKLTYQNTVATHGQDPCHVALSPDGNTLYCANFMSGSTTAFPVREDGSLEKDSCFIQHVGSGPDPKRQQGPHAHGVFLSPSGKWLYVPDLGSDTLICYAQDAAAHRLIPAPGRNILLPNKGEGARHMAFHPNGKWLYVNTEMGSAVYAYRYDEESGQAELRQRLSTIPEGTGLQSTSTAAIRIHPNGRLLYVSNRGHNSLATYRIDGDSGLLTLLSIQPTGGSIPREFAISPNGKTMVVAHQSSDDVCVFSVDEETGSLSFRSKTTVPNPICVQFL